MLEMLFLKVVQATRGVVIEQLLSTHYALNTTVRYEVLLPFSISQMREQDLKSDRFKVILGPRWSGSGLLNATLGCLFKMQILSSILAKGPGICILRWSLGNS